MLFSSVIFLFYFLPAALALYYTVFRWNMQLRNLLLLSASLLFYAWGEPKNIVLLIVSCAVNWLLVLLIGRYKRAAKPLLILACVWNLGLLGTYKYLDFVIGSVNTVAGTTLLPQVGLPMPLGISFFTLQAISYVADVYRGKAAARKNPLYAMLYITLFPYLAAGPLMRYTAIEEQLLHRSHSWTLFCDGTWRFVQGLAKKLLLANTFAVVADHVYSITMAGHNLIQVPVLLAWLGALAYSLQIFYDFSGYSDMAIGLGKMFGFTLEENFNHPYMSRSVGEFWRRWHISLGSWFREYVYLPLGGSRVENRDAMARNLLIVWVLAGLWHGASWRFVLWGFFNFACILMERLLLFERWDGPKWVKHLYTMLAVILGWVMFRSESFYQFSEYVGNMFGTHGNGFYSDRVWMFLREYAVFWIAGVLLCVPTVSWVKGKLRSFSPKLETAVAVASPVCMLCLAGVCMLYLVKGNGDIPFIYFYF